MKLSILLEGVEHTLWKIDGDTEISLPVSDSREAVRNSLFICINGTHRRGTDYVKEAMRRGAAACVSESELPSDIPCVLVDNVRRATAFIWNNYYGRPADSLRLFGVTGTCGKTSTALFLKSILEASGRKTGLIGTLGCFAGDEKIETESSEVPDIAAAMTTPDPRYLYGALRRMRDSGCEDAVIEVSSHSVYQHKIDALSFFGGIFTNLSPEHLDLHGNMEEYFRVKKSFFDKCKLKVYNRDDPYCRRFYPTVYNFGLSDGENTVISAKKTEYLLNCGEEKIKIETGVTGSFTVYNTMAAATCAYAAGISPSHIKEGIYNVSSIPGRMERAVSPEDFGFGVYIDFAHTPVALKEALSGLSEMKPSRLTVLFGCGGDRDREKRAPMGEIAAEYADRVIVTSDNCRNEDRNSIIDDILRGVPHRSGIAVIPERKEAIAYALESVIEGELILLAGKGQEEYEIIGDEKIPFSEKKIIAELLQRKYGKS